MLVAAVVAPLGISSARAAWEPQVTGVSVTAEPRIYGGSPALGSGQAVALSLFDGTGWTGNCTAAMWKPNLLLTNAHCITQTGSSAGVQGYAVFPPGITAVRYANLLQGQAPVQVVRTWIPSGYANVSSQVQANDIAVLQLSGDLAPSGFTRLATGAEFERWTAERAATTITGYGLIGPKQSSFDPFSVTQPLVQATAQGQLGSTFRTDQSPAGGICPGDSGSPAFRTDAAGTILLGVMAGGSAPCITGTDEYRNLGFAAMGYLSTLNQALAAVGRPTIPGAPVNISTTAANRTITVTWQPPTVSPETVVGYDVVDAGGNVQCTTTELSCVMPDRPDGLYAFTVRARNAEGEGDADPLRASGSVRVGPPVKVDPPQISQNANGRYRITFRSQAGLSSAVITSYVIRDGKGAVICSGGITPVQANLEYLSCLAPKKKGSYRVRITGKTEMGKIPASALSKRFVIR